MPKQQELARQLDEIWKADLLGRRDDAEFLEGFLTGRIMERSERGLAKSFVLNIDADWGRGKSFFLSRFAQHLSTRGYLVAEVNAWRDDHASDPLIALMAAIDGAMAPHLRSTANRSAWQAIKQDGATVAVAVGKGFMNQIAKKYVGSTLGEIASAVSLEKEGAEAIADEASRSLDALLDKGAERLLAAFKETQISIENFRGQLGNLLTKHEGSQNGPKAPMFVLVDELDRCRPTYAIALLERVKHLFDADNVVFVMATNTSQLRHAVGAVYGAGFDAERYLCRFFDRSYTFAAPELDAFVTLLMREYHIHEERFALPPGLDLVRLFSGSFKYFGIGLRDAHQVVDMLRTCLTVWPFNSQLQVIAMLPLIIGQQQGLSPSYETSFQESIERLAQTRGDRNGLSICFPFPAKIARTASASAVKFDILQLFKLYSKSLNEPLPDLLQPGDSEASHWISVQFGSELEQRFPNGLGAEERPRSFVADYPRLVASAGRFLPA